MSQNSYPFTTYSGLLEPSHYKRIGSAIWLFLWCISATTAEKEKEGTVWGIVLGNKPLQLPEMAEQFGVSDKTVSRWLSTLEENEYIRVTRAPRGLILSVKNSKKYMDRIPDKNVQSPSGEETKMSDHIPSDQTHMSDHSDKNVRSNKDIIKILIDRLIDKLNDPRLTDERCGVLTTVVATYSPKEIHLDEQSIAQRAAEMEQHYMQRRERLSPAGADWVSVQRVAKMPIPMEFITFGIDLAFARKAATRRWPSDEINQFSYCERVIIGTWNRLMSDIATSAMPAEPAAIPEGQSSRKTKQQRELEELERKREEALKREEF